MATADRRLFFTADRSELVEEGDPDAAFLAAAPGRVVPDVPLRKAGVKPAEDKAVRGPAEDKSGADAGGDVHVCDVCGFEAASAGGLGSHQRIHED